MLLGLLPARGALCIQRLPLSVERLVLPLELCDALPQAARVRLRGRSVRRACVLVAAVSPEQPRLQLHDHGAKLVALLLYFGNVCLELCHLRHGRRRAATARRWAAGVWVRDRPGAKFRMKSNRSWKQNGVRGF